MSKVNQIEVLTIEPVGPSIIDFDGSEFSPGQKPAAVRVTVVVSYDEDQESGCCDVMKIKVSLKREEGQTLEYIEEAAKSKALEYAKMFIAYAS